ncbi:histidine kinase [Fulvivirgaceae bacterium BMA10]|uniref:Histidine kinase n=1 Tax=Splendidivirga corallicola TaxID=3051826 RepID=A0ABT8KNS3_9BACT|nr:histidine kinase [Fulvivirgaceae bacterium BMA10]
MKTSFNYKKVIIHLSLWLGYAMLLLYWLALFSDAQTALPHVIRVVIIHSLLFYINTDVLLPHLIEKNKYILYILGIIALIVGMQYLFKLSNELPIIRESLDQLRPRRMRFIPPKRPPFHRLLSANLISSFSILFISTTYWVISQARTRKQKEIALKNENLKTEMKFLKSQINPHFLFNALNNIYSLSFRSSKKTPDMIMKLSNMLRYVLYDSNEKKVPLQNEITYIQHFIDFQRLKIEGEPNIRIDFENADNQVKVEPMLFIPFVENSFKHSKIEDTETSWISMKFETEGKKVIFTIMNSVPKSAFSKDKTGGIGLQNVKKRLELLYPEKHDLKIETRDNQFLVKLIVDTK